MKGKSSTQVTHCGAVVGVALLPSHTGQIRITHPPFSSMIANSFLELFSVKSSLDSPEVDFGFVRQLSHRRILRFQLVDDHRIQSPLVHDRRLSYPVTASRFCFMMILGGVEHMITYSRLKVKSCSESYHLRPCGFRPPGCKLRWAFLLSPVAPRTTASYVA